MAHFFLVIRRKSHQKTRQNRSVLSPPCTTTTIAPYTLLTNVFKTEPEAEPEFNYLNHGSI